MTATDAAPQPNILYTYPAPSTLDHRGRESKLFLATSSQDGNPWFFEGRAKQPKRLAAMLLMMGKTARSRYHIPPAMLNRILAEADPVVTSGRSWLRFEAFSACCGVYARADLHHDAFEGELKSTGVTNVDFNPPFRQALAKVRTGENLLVSVGQRHVKLQTKHHQVVERKVTLPPRWFRGFLEVQAVQARMRPVLSLQGLHIQRFFRQIPKQPGKAGHYLARAGQSLRLSQRDGKDTVFVGGLSRLRLMEDLGAEAQSLRVFTDDRQASAFELTFDDHHRLTLVLSPDHWRGFSGEGRVLEMATENSLPTAPLHAALRWSDDLDPAPLAAELGVDVPTIHRALAVLAANGKVGFDLGAGRYFHRELPFDPARFESIQPRLAAAKRLLEQDMVQLESHTDWDTKALVQGSGVRHSVHLAPDGDHCTCPWHAKHQGARGPCKHITAVRLFKERLRHE